jgi:hypothetical protein
MVFERLARDLARTFTLSRLAPEANVDAGVVGDFLFLQDNDFGTRTLLSEKHVWRESPFGVRPNYTE